MRASLSDSRLHCRHGSSLLRTSSPEMPMFVCRYRPHLGLKFKFSPGAPSLRAGAAVKRPRLENREELRQSCSAGFAQLLQFFRTRLATAVDSCFQLRAAQAVSDCFTSPFSCLSFHRCSVLLVLTTYLIGFPNLARLPKPGCKKTRSSLIPLAWVL